MNILGKGLMWNSIFIFTSKGIFWFYVNKAQSYYNEMLCNFQKYFVIHFLTTLNIFFYFFGIRQGL